MVQANIPFTSKKKKTYNHIGFISVYVVQHVDVKYRVWVEYTHEVKVITFMWISNKNTIFDNTYRRKEDTT